MSGNTVDRTTANIPRILKFVHLKAIKEVSKPEASHPNIQRLYPKGLSISGVLDINHVARIIKVFVSFFLIYNPIKR